MRAPARHPFASSGSAAAFSAPLPGLLLSLDRPGQVFLEAMPLKLSAAAAAAVTASTDTTPPQLKGISFVIDQATSSIKVGVQLLDQNSPLVDEVAYAVLYISTTGSLADAAALDVTNLFDAAAGTLAYKHSADPALDYTFWLEASDRQGNVLPPTLLGTRSASSPLASSSGSVTAGNTITFTFSLA